MKPRLPEGGNKNFLFTLTIFRGYLPTFLKLKRAARGGLGVK